MVLFFITLLPFLGVFIWVLNLGRTAAAGLAFALSGASFIALLSLAPAVFAGQPVSTTLEWLPALGLNVAFFADGLGLFFAGIILGIGLLIIAYARAYLAPGEDAARFFGCLLLFQGAMLGVVLSDNMLLLVVFWELTSLSSFLLIGFWSHRPEGRQGARMALVVTGTGGLALLAGMILLGRWPAPTPCRTILLRGRCRARLAALRRRSSRWSCSAPSPSRRSFRSTSGCRTPWRRRRPSPPICTRPPW